VEGIADQNSQELNALLQKNSVKSDFLMLLHTEHCLFSVERYEIPEQETKPHKKLDSLIGNWSGKKKIPFQNKLSLHQHLFKLRRIRREAIDKELDPHESSDDDVAKSILNLVEELVQENGIGSNIDTIFHKLRGEKHQE
jgi:hypothetical protein